MNNIGKAREAYFAAAKSVSELSNFPRVKIGCITVYKHKIISSGFNSRKTSPIQKKYNAYRFSADTPHCIHAEISCLKPLIGRKDIDFKNVERGLRATNYVLGDEKPDYISETAAKFTKPVLLPGDRMNPENKISTAQLQQSHYVFGTNKEPWVTTQQLSFGPKKVEQKLYSKNLTKTNFILGEDEPTLKSVNQETFVKHPISVNPINKELANDLRSKSILIFFIFV